MLEGFTPWPAELASRYRERGYWRDQPLGDIVDRAAETFGEREALVGGSQRISYRELKRRVDRLALHLRRLGLRPRDRVVLHLNNTPEFVYVYYGCVKIGVLPVMALLPHRFSEIRYLAEFSGAVAYVGPTTLRGFDYQRLAREVRQAVPSLRHILVAGPEADPNLVALDALLDDRIEDGERPDRLADVRPDPADVALFLLSGGTTGLPKLIPRTHNDYEYNSRASGGLCGIGPDTVYLTVLPVSHNFPLASPGLQSVLQLGGRVVLCDSTEPAEAFRLVEQERVTHTALVPALAMRWMDAPERERFDLSSLRVLQVGGARLNPEPARRIRPTLGCQLQQVFGMAEGLLNYTRLDDPDEEIVETQGRPCSPDDEIRIVDEEGGDVPPGSPGELLARGPYTIRGYYNVPEHNQRAFTPDGFYRSGDIVRLSPGGNLVVEGRAKDLINRGGEKISAEEIENLVLAHPSVFDAAAIAMPDPVLGERTCVYVILRPGASLTFQELVAFLQAQQIARFKLPERLEIVDSFPLTSLGKVSKKDLRDDIARRLEAERAAARAPSTTAATAGAQT
ncbi:MAG: AMP-binding protein [Chloroflexota bacterium]|nr:AMP-binding protein [Chloroflexota bacterium]